MKSPAEYRSLADRLKTIHHECLDAEIRSATWGAADALDGIAQALEQDRAVKEYCGACGATINSRAHALQLAAAQQEIARRRDVFVDTQTQLLAAQKELATINRKLELCERVIEAAKFANWCPDAGGYVDGRSIEDCYERLHESLVDHFKCGYPDSLYVPMPDYITEAELDKRIQEAATALADSQREGT